MSNKIPDPLLKRIQELKAENAELVEEVAVVGYLYAVCGDLLLDHQKPNLPHEPLMTVAQHKRLMAAKDGDVVKLDGLIRANQQMGRIYLHFKTTEQHHAALRELRTLLGGAG